MPDMTPERLAEIKARVDAATAGPWAERPTEYDDWGVIRDANGDIVCDAASPCHFEMEDCGKPEAPSPIPENRRFIANARQDIPALIAALESAWAEVERLKDRVKEFEESVSTCENCKKPLDYISVCIKCGCCPKCCDEINCDGG